MRSVVLKFINSFKSTEDLVYVPRRFAEGFKQRLGKEYVGGCSAVTKLTSRGSAYISRGHPYSSNELEAKRKRILQHDFSA